MSPLKYIFFLKVHHERGETKQDAEPGSNRRKGKSLFLNHCY